MPNTKCPILTPILTRILTRILTAIFTAILTSILTAILTAILTPIYTSIYTSILTPIYINLAYTVYKYCCRVSISRIKGTEPFTTGRLLPALCPAFPTAVPSFCKLCSSSVITSNQR